MIPAILAGGAALAGGWMANRGKAKEAAKDRNFQERMSSTSWQRGLADMEAAGINPALAYSKGGASTPGGAMAGQENIAEGAVSSALQATRMKAELSLIKKQGRHVDMQTVKARQDANVAKTSAYRNIQLEINDKLTNDIMQLNLPWLRAQSGAAQKYGNQAALMQLILNSGGSQAAGLVGGLGLASVVRQTRKLPISKGR